MERGRIMAIHSVKVEWCFRPFWLYAVSGVCGYCRPPDLLEATKDRHYFIG